MSKDLYNILGVDKNATESDIKKGYRKMAMKHHPDKNPDDKDAEAKFKDVAEAYDILSDPDKKARYDSMGYDGYSNSGGGRQNHTHFAGGVHDFFNQMHRQEQSANLKRKFTIVQKIKLTMAEVYHGVIKKFKIGRLHKCSQCGGQGGDDIVRCTECNGKGIRSRVRQTEFATFRETVSCDACDGRGFKIGNKCNTCHGNGVEKRTEIIDVNIPHSIMPNQQMMLAGKGHYYVDDVGPTYGNLVLIMEVDETDFTMLRDYSLLSQIDLPYETLVLGGEFLFTTVDGVTVNVTVSKLTKIGHKLRLANKGLGKPDFKDVRGDQYISVELKFPTEVSKEEEELLEKIKKIKK